MNQETHHEVFGLLNKFLKQYEKNFYGYMSNPIIPGVWNQPDFLIVPALGKKIILYLYWIPKRGSNNWSFILAAIEDLFEIKTKTGGETIVGCVIIQNVDSSGELQPDMNQLIANLFDFSFQFRYEDLISKKNSAAEEIYSRIISSTPKQDYYKIWNHERMVNRENLKRYDFKNAKELLTKGELSDVPGSEVENIIWNELTKVQDRYDVQRNVSVPNIKNFFLSNQTQYFFSFDFVINSTPPVIVEVIRGKNRFAYKKYLRALCAKARFIRYEYFGHAGLNVRNPDYQLYLLISDEINGPDYDPLRYINVLVEAGWNPSRADLFNIRKLHLKNR